MSQSQALACQTRWNRHCLSPIISSAPIPNQSSVAKAWQEFDDEMTTDE